MKKLISAIIISIIFLNIINMNLSFAVINPDDYTPNEINEGFLATDMANKIIGGFQAIGSIVSVFALVLLGVKYMMGSIEEKAEYKETMIAYVIGAILVFAISNISALIYNFATTLHM